MAALRLDVVVFLYIRLEILSPQIQSTPAQGSAFWLRPSGRAMDVSADSLIPFVQAVTIPGSTIHTDGWRGYARLPALGYQHHVTVISAGSDPAHVAMPRVHNVASLLKRWLMGTHQGGIQYQHLDYYLDEFTFRFKESRKNKCYVCRQSPLTRPPSASALSHSGERA